MTNVSPGNDSALAFYVLPILCTSKGAEKMDMKGPPVAPCSATLSVSPEALRTPYGVAGGSESTKKGVCYKDPDPPGTMKMSDDGMDVGPVLLAS